MKSANVEAEPNVTVPVVVRFVVLIEVSGVSAWLPALILGDLSGDDEWDVIVECAAEN